MKRETIERTPEEIQQMIRTNKRQYSLVAAIIWAVCSVIWAVLLVLDVVHHAAALQVVLHSVCIVCTVCSAVLHFVGWWRMSHPESQTGEEPSAIPEDDQENV